MGKCHFLLLQTIKFTTVWRRDRKRRTAAEQCAANSEKVPREKVTTHWAIGWTQPVYSRDAWYEHNETNNSMRVFQKFALNQDDFKLELQHAIMELILSLEWVNSNAAY